MKINIVASPTFKARVAIPVADELPAEFVEFEFRHQVRDKFAKWLETIEGTPKTKLIFSIVSGWEFTDPYNEETLDTLLSNYLGAADAILDTYLKRLAPSRLGN